MWDLIHDRTHMHGDLPFDPFMIKQRMPFFLYSLEELRCDLTAFRESVKLEKDEDADPGGTPARKLVQYAVIFDRIFRFAITGSRVRNYDGLGGQLLFAWLHQHHVLHWTDNKLSIDWDEVADVVIELGAQIEELYWRSIDRPKIGPLARRLRAGLRHRHAPPGLGLGQGPGRPAAGRAAPRPDGRRCSTTSSRCPCSTRRWRRRCAPSSNPPPASRGPQTRDQQPAAPQALNAG